MRELIHCSKQVSKIHSQEQCFSEHNQRPGLIGYLSPVSEDWFWISQYIRMCVGTLTPLFFISNRLGTADISPSGHHVMF